MHNQDNNANKELSLKTLHHTVKGLLRKHLSDKNHIIKEEDIENLNLGIDAHNAWIEKFTKFPKLRHRADALANR